ncbi:MAG: TonB-dependent receptor [Cyanobacteria bacterium P01_H01_bin.130]
MENPWAKLANRLTFGNFAQGFSIPEIGINAAFSVPREVDLSDDFGLEPQRVDSFEIGARAEFGRVQASVSGFYNESDLGNSLIVNEDGFAEFGRAPQRNYGFEATLDWQPSDVWRLGGYVSWNEGEFENADGDFVALSSLEVQPIKVGFYVENDTTPTWTNRLQLLSVGDRDRAFNDEVDAFETEGYITFDLISTLKLGPGRLRVGIENLLNNQYIPLSSQERFGGTAERRFAAPGIRLTVGYSATF